MSKETSAEIDRQDRHFICQANALSAAVAADADKATLLGMTEEIATDAAFHFLYEGRILLDSDYAEAEGHIAEHRRLERQARLRSLAAVRHDDGRGVAYASHMPAGGRGSCCGRQPITSDQREVDAS